jgi:hypothetical protein
MVGDLASGDSLERSFGTEGKTPTNGVIDAVSTTQVIGGELLARIARLFDGWDASRRDADLLGQLSAIGAHTCPAASGRHDPLSRRRVE